jgi:hypothetical protein
MNKISISHGSLRPIRSLNRRVPCNRLSNLLVIRKGDRMLQCLPITTQHRMRGMRNPKWHLLPSRVILRKIRQIARQVILSLILDWEVLSVIWHNLSLSVNGVLQGLELAAWRVVLHDWARGYYGGGRRLVANDAGGGYTLRRLEFS